MRTVRGLKRWNFDLISRRARQPEEQTSASNQSKGSLPGETGRNRSRAGHTGVIRPRRRPPTPASSGGYARGTGTRESYAGRRWRRCRAPRQSFSLSLFYLSLFFSSVGGGGGGRWRGREGGRRRRDEAVGGAVIEATKQRSDGWFPRLKGTHGLRVDCSHRKKAGFHLTNFTL